MIYLIGVSLLDLADERLQGKGDLTEGLELALWGHLLGLRRSETELGHGLVYLLRLMLLLVVGGSCSSSLLVHLLVGHVGQGELRPELDGDRVDMHGHHTGNALRWLLLLLPEERER